MADSVQLHEIRRAIAELGDLPEKDLGLKPAPQLREAFEVQLLGFGLIPSQFRLWDWAAYQLRRRRVSVLSEFAVSLADPRVDPALHRRFVKRCSEKQLAC